MRSRARLLRLLGALLVAGGVAALVLQFGEGREDRAIGQPPATEKAGNCDLPDQRKRPMRPAACWRPYAKDSPFNTPIPYKPKLNGRSDRIVRAITVRPPGPIIAGLDGTDDDYGRPVYFSGPDDPWFRVRGPRDWGRCALEGRRIRVPDAALPAAGGDGHLTVVDAASGWEYDLYEVEDKPAGGGDLVTAWGGRTRIDGDGLGSAAVAANFGTLAGLLRPEELEAGRIEHALFMTVPCVAEVDGEDTVYPATGQARPCEDDTEAPALGSRIQLMMLPKEIEALDAEPWQKTLLHAMAEYGMFVGDTGGGNTWRLQHVSDTMYTSFGQPPRLVEFAKRAGWRRVPDGESGRTHYLGEFGDVVDWRERLRVVAPCVTAGDC